MKPNLESPLAAEACARFTRRSFLSVFQHKIVALSKLEAKKWRIALFYSPLNPSTKDTQVILALRDRELISS